MERISPLLEVEAQSDDAGARVGSKRSGGPTSHRVRLARPLVERVEQPFHLEVGQRELIAQPAREQRLAVAHGGQAADDLDARRAQGVEVQRRTLRRSDQLRRGEPARTRRGRRSRRSARSTLPTHPSTTARRARDRSAAAARARRPTASPVGPSGWISSASCTPVAEAPTTSTPPSGSWSDAVVERREALDRRRHGLAQRRHMRRRCKRRSRAPRLRQRRSPRVGRDVVAVVGPRDGRDGRLRPHGAAATSAIARDERDHLGHRHEAVGIGAVVTIARQAASASSASAGAASPSVRGARSSPPRRARAPRDRSSAR